VTLVQNEGISQSHRDHSPVYKSAKVSQPLMLEAPCPDEKIMEGGGDPLLSAGTVFPS
jgi:hypothetical protein